MKRFYLLMSLTSAIIFILLNCAPYKMKAIRAQRDHRYDLSVKFALKHLSSHPDDQFAIQLLNKASRGYYSDIQRQIQHFENLNDWAKVVRVAEQGYLTLSEVTRVVGTDFPTKNELAYLQSKSEQSKFNQANELYSEALQLYQNEDYAEALAKLKTIDSFIPHFKNVDVLIIEINQRLAEQNYQQAQELVKQGQLESALENFEQTAKYVPNFRDVENQLDRLRQQLADTYFDQGQLYYNATDYKKAYHAFTKSLSYKSDHPLATNLLNDTKEKLTVRLAVFPFSSSKLDQKFGNLVSQQILTQALPRKSEFVMFLEREHLQKIFEEQALSQTGVIDEQTAVQVGKMSGVNTIIVGSVTLISDQKTGPTKRILTDYYDKKYRDPKGVQRTKREPFNYTEYEVGRTVEVSLSYRLISVETGGILFNESLAERVTDTAQWVACPSEFVTLLSASAKSKLTAATEPKSKESLINQTIDSLTKRAVAKIMSQVAPSW